MKKATLCYLQKDNKILMVNVTKPGMNFGNWNGLGGKLDEGESLEECAIREVFEESGIRMKNPNLVGLLHFPNNLSTGDHWDVYVYTANEFEGGLISNSAEGNLKWIENTELLSLKLNKGDYVFIPWILEGKIFEATFDHEGTIVNNKFFGNSTSFKLD